MQQIGMLEENLIFFFDDKKDGQSTFHQAYLPPTEAPEPLTEREREREVKNVGDTDTAADDNEE